MRDARRSLVPWALCAAFITQVVWPTLGAAQPPLEGGAGLGPAPRGSAPADPDEVPPAGQPRDEAPAEEAPTERPAEEAPTERPAEETPAEETPAEETPAAPTDGGEEAVPPPPGSAETVPPPPSAEEARPRLIVIDAAPYGVDPVVGRHVSRKMREIGEVLGYEVLAGEVSVGAAQRLRMPYPPAPADLWRVTYVAEAQRGAFARVWAHQGQYVIEVTVASLDGTGPFFARGTSGAGDLHDVVERLLREALPAATRWDAAGAQALRDRPTQPQLVVRPPLVIQHPPARPPPEQRPDRRPGRRFDIAVATEAAIGTSDDRFYNHLFGARLGYRITRDIMMGVYVGYANLNGRDGRAHNVLTYLQLEDRIRVSSSSDITVPLRFSLGYLPFNGPFLRLAAGVNIPLSDRVEVAFDVLAPTFWVVPDGTAVSLDLGAELIFRL